ncbi:hypothetical protein [Nocardioides bruguierae]|uniref:Uncharacterized protein n=1 Tax=Nocardioides bruguierae TaxID=2945102 RepID=A0A9X2DCI2_9ACTN|nr:hypothetical protein [Nocardioides bruguierae]MCM0622847.1 hypothetical protein [Nocardioides bruguierae]
MTTPQLHHDPNRSRTNAPTVASTMSHRLQRHPLADFIRNSTLTAPDTVTGLIAAEDRLIDLEQQIQQRPQTLDEFLGETVSDLVAGKPLPDDIGVRVSEIAAAEQAADQAALAMQQIQHRLRSRWDTTAHDAADELLEHLREDLTSILTEARTAVTALDGLDVQDSEAVAEATDKQRAALAALKALRPRYRRLRSQQTDIVEAVYERPDSASPHDATAWRWKHVWASRIHEFENVYATAPKHDTRDVLWFRELTTRTDVWLPNIDDLRTSWSEIQHWHSPGKPNPTNA